MLNDNIPLSTSFRITKVKAFYRAIPLGKRKEIFHSYPLVTLPDHVLLTPEQFNDYERLFWQSIKSLHKVPPKSASINVNWGEYDGVFTSIQLPSKQKQLVMP